jgi:hypothetical protein
VTDNQYKGIFCLGSEAFFKMEGYSLGFGRLTLITVAAGSGVGGLSGLVGIYVGCTDVGGVTGAGIDENCEGGRDWITENCPLFRSSFRFGGDTLTLSISL